MHIAVIGAGISGLTCARQLQVQGHSVTVYEKSADVSGRMSTRQTEFGGFDHGAQYLTASSDVFRKRLAAWKKAGLIIDWSPNLVRLEQGAHKPAPRSPKRFIAIPGMGALCTHLAQGLDVRCEQVVRRIEPFGKQWLLSVGSPNVAIDASAGPFDAVLLAVPAEQALPLLAAAPALAKQVAKAKLSPCWALMLSFPLPLALGYDGAWVSGSRLGWIMRDNAKPEHRAGERWVAHASNDWSVRHLEDDEERVQEKLLKAFHEATGSQVQPVHVSAHRWRYAQAQAPLAENCLWRPRLRIGTCGDWFAAGLEGCGRIENAYLSGLALAAAVGS
ncbi:NAD(P)/FAD-dependent oxidoreductase [Herminiimonas sp. CN]|uniref:NAD(P)/FAD-dependent oxidoreductase n=1 Tax=Herminiimonas sp. CN TaxID=1349818 RepID=UPI0005548A61|nr:FAD-dependent oxidoreductase [Herminiimonas sp. CN]